MQDCNGKQCPYVDTKPLDEQTDTPLLRQKKLKMYQQLVGDLRYIAHSTRLDIYYIKNRPAQCMRNSREQHWQILKSVLRHLKQIIHQALMYPPMPTIKNPNIVTCSDSDCANAKYCKSITCTLHLHISPFLGTPRIPMYSINLPQRPNMWLHLIHCNTHHGSEDSRGSVWFQRLLFM